MTHQELLDKLAYTPHTDPNGKYMYRALRAVVELHKPFEAYRQGTACLECSNTQNMPYPCPTIEAIEAELND